MPQYQPELDIVAVASDGSLAGFCVGWLNSERHTGLIEPLGVHPRFHHLGIGRALLLEALRRFRLTVLNVFLSRLKKTATLRGLPTSPWDFSQYIRFTVRGCGSQNQACNNSSCRSFPVQYCMLNSTWRDTITDAVEMFDFALQLEIEAIVGGLRYCHDGKGQVFKLARLTGVVVDDGGAVGAETS